MFLCTFCRFYSNLDVCIKKFLCNVPRITFKYVNWNPAATSVNSQHKTYIMVDTNHWFNVVWIILPCVVLFMFSGCPRHTACPCWSCVILLLLLSDRWIFTKTQDWTALNIKKMLFTLSFILLSKLYIIMSYIFYYMCLALVFPCRINL